VKDQDRNKAWGFTLFGDDIRLEVGGKMSVMGLYQADMLFPNNIPFPINIPKFCVLVMYYEQRGAVEGDVVFKVTYGPENRNLIEFPISRQDLGGQEESVIPPEDVTPEDRERIGHSRIPIVLAPFTIPEKGRLRVRAHYADGSVLKLGSIAVRQMPVDDFNKIFGVGPLQPIPPS
jgi:hypothetical protein